MRTPEEFSVRFNRRVPRAIAYVDRDGELTFHFDPPSRRRVIALHSRPVLNGEPIGLRSGPGGARLESALRRVVAFLEAKRYSVSTTE